MFVNDEQTPCAKLSESRQLNKMCSFSHQTFEFNIDSNSYRASTILCTRSSDPEYCIQACSPHLKQYVGSNSWQCQW